MNGGSRFRIKPNPPEAGQPLDVTYVGPASEIVMQVDAGPPIRLKVGKGGKVRIPQVPSGDELMLSDQQDIRGYLHSRILELS